MWSPVCTFRSTVRPAGFHAGAVLAMLLVMIAGVVHAAPDARATIEGGRRVGSFEIGKPWGPYGRTLGPATSTRQSENSSNARLMYYKKYGLFFFVKKDVVNGITVVSPLFATSGGVHVGSTRAAVVAKYGAPQSLRRDEVVYPEHGIGFTYEGEQVVKIYVFDKEARDLAKGDRLVVPGSRVGGIRLGASIQTVAREWKDPEKQADVPQKKGARVWAYTSKGVNIVVSEGVIDAVWIFSPEFRTAKGIHVGSKRAEVVAAYGKPSGRTEDIESYGKAGLDVKYEDGVARQIFIRRPR